MAPTDGALHGLAGHGLYAWRIRAGGWGHVRWMWRRVRFQVRGMLVLPGRYYRYLWKTRSGRPRG